MGKGSVYSIIIRRFRKTTTTYEGHFLMDIKLLSEQITTNIHETGNLSLSVVKNFESLNNISTKFVDKFKSITDMKFNEDNGLIKGLLEGQEENNKLTETSLNKFDNFFNFEKKKHKENRRRATENKLESASKFEPINKIDTDSAKKEKGESLKSTFGKYGLVGLLGAALSGITTTVMGWVGKLGGLISSGLTGILGLGKSAINKVFPNTFNPKQNKNTSSLSNMGQNAKTKPSSLSNMGKKAKNIMPKGVMSKVGNAAKVLGKATLRFIPFLGTAIMAAEAVSYGAGKLMSDEGGGTAALELDRMNTDDHKVVDLGLKGIGKKAQIKDWDVVESLPQGRIQGLINYDDWDYSTLERLKKILEEKNLNPVTKVPKGINDTPMSNVDKSQDEKTKQEKETAAGVNIIKGGDTSTSQQITNNNINNENNSSQSGSRSQYQQRFLDQGGRGPAPQGYFA